MFHTSSLQAFFYKAESENDKPDPSEMLKYWGTFLLEIRRDLNDGNTKLIYKDMLKSMIKDI